MVVYVWTPFKSIDFGSNFEAIGSEWKRQWANLYISTLPETKQLARANWWLEDDSCPFGMACFSGAKMLVSGSVSIFASKGQSIC